MKNARRRAREIALQALYAWQVGGGELADVLEQARALEGYARADRALAEELIRGVVERAGELEHLIAPYLAERRYAALSPVERVILCIAALELVEHVQTPFKVVLNEAIELGKSFGGAQGHRFVNGVLERLAAQLRPDEVARAGRARQTA